MSEGAKRIAAERRRQVEREGWSPDHDDGHEDGSLACAAASYALEAAMQSGGRSALLTKASEAAWPWDADDWKPKDVLRNLERAGALIAAEIDRLLRAAREGTEPAHDR